MISSQRGGQSVNSFTHSGRERVGLSDHKHTHKGGGRTREERGNALSLSLSLSSTSSLSLPLFFSLLLDQIRSKSKTNSTYVYTSTYLEFRIPRSRRLLRLLFVSSSSCICRRSSSPRRSLSFSLSFSLSCAVRSRRRASFAEFFSVFSFSRFLLSSNDFFQFSKIGGLNNVYHRTPILLILFGKFGSTLTLSFLFSQKSGDGDETSLALVCVGWGGRIVVWGGRIYAKVRLCFSVVSFTIT